MKEKEKDLILDGINISERIRKHDLIPDIIDMITQGLTKRSIYWADMGYYGSISFMDLISAAEGFAPYMVSGGAGRYMDSVFPYSNYLAGKIRRERDDIKMAMGQHGLKIHDLAEAIEQRYHVNREFANALYDAFTKENVLHLLAENPRYADLAVEAERKDKEMRQIRDGIAQKIPDQYQDMFPEARKLHRHFILHLGPTNSGKTHDAMVAFRKAKSGAYLAPLRLLAYEAFEDSKTFGCPCSMVTGEEELLVENAEHVSSTIEMANLYKHYEVCVIDEGQMVADEDRGGAWTAAIVGMQADVIHICASECARTILLDLIKSCGDSFEIFEHHRSVPLMADTEEFAFPESVRPHDALIVFSKRSVIYVAAELQKRGWKVSVIYGALPYESRRTEIGRFIDGETNVVVATDAIGMGMNLPVERIVFLETEKFDGKKRRPLTEQEVKQIAGRAGRQDVQAGAHRARRPLAEEK